MKQRAKLSGRDILGCLLLGISVILLGRSLMLCFSNDIWYDELFTVGMAEHSYRELISLTARDVHPPLYYIIVKVILEFWRGLVPAVSTVAVVKTVSVLPYFFLFLYSITFIRKRFGLLPGGLFLFCSIAMPQLSGYTVEMRMYSWALLFVTAAFLHGCGTVDPVVREAGIGDAAGGEKRMRTLHGAALVIYGLAAAYTQYFACVAVIMIYGYVLYALFREDRGRLKEWFLWTAVSAAGYAPWLIVLYRQMTAVNAGYWILPLSWRTFGGCVKFLMKPAFTNEFLSVGLAVVMTGVYTAVILWNMIKLCHDGRESQAVFMAAGVGTLAGLVLFGFIASMLFRPIFVYRYMIPAMGCFWLSFAVGVDGIWQNRKSGKHSRGMPAAIVLLVVVVGLRDYRAFMGEEEYKILLMKETEAALSSIAPDDVVVYNFDQVQAVTSWYLPAETESYLWRGTPEALIQEIIRPYDVLEESAALKKWCEEGRNVWFIGSFNSRDDLVEEWRTEGLEVDETGSYLLERYWFNLYKISG